MPLEAGKQGKGRPGRISLEGKEDFCLGAFLYGVENGRIGQKLVFVQDKARRRDAGRVKKKVLTVH